MTDVELEARVTALEENTGGGADNVKLNDRFLDIFLFIYNMKLYKVAQI